MVGYVFAQDLAFIISIFLFSSYIYRKNFPAFIFSCKTCVYSFSKFVICFTDDECEKNAMGFSSKMTEKLEKYMKSLPPYLGEPSVNHRLIKLIEEVMELNEIEMK